jgi:hypothetical protein
MAGKKIYYEPKCRFTMTLTQTAIQHKQQDSPSERGMQHERQQRAECSSEGRNASERQEEPASRFRPKEG